MESRFAFTAQFWGDSAVVCRAVEDRPGPVVEQQFGEFPSWTQAYHCASKLNEGLGLDPHEVRRIVTSSLLATARVVEEALNSTHLWEGTRVEIAARAAQLQFVLSELALALTFCRTATILSGAPVLCALERAAKALRHSTRFLQSCDGGYRDLEQLAAFAGTVQAALQRVSSSSFLFLPLPSSSLAK